MRIVRTEGLDRLAPTSVATVRSLIDHAAEGGRMSVTEVDIPPGEELREHDHGGSEALLVPLAGVLAMVSGVQREDITTGMVALLDKGERVSLSNQTSEPFTMIVVFTSASEPTGDSCAAELPEEVSGGGGKWTEVPPETMDQLADEMAVHVDLAGHPICLARSGGVIYAILDECSHGHVELSEGEVEHGNVECWLHGSLFDLATGVPVCPPATEPVPVYPVRISDDGVEVALPPSAPT